MNFQFHIWVIPSLFNTAFKQIFESIWVCDPIDVLLKKLYICVRVLLNNVDGIWETIVFIFPSYIYNPVNSGTVCKFWLCKYLNTEISIMGFTSEYMAFTGFDIHLSFVPCDSAFFVKFLLLLSEVVWSLSTHCNSLFSEKFSFF